MHFFDLDHPTEDASELVSRHGNKPKYLRGNIADEKIRLKSRTG